MRKLPEVETAKALMTEAQNWSVFTWLFQKSRVRETADRANDALDDLNRRTKSHWPADLKTAYKALSAKGKGRSNGASPRMDETIETLLRKVKEADDDAHRARMTAEETFDRAERELNSALAREGCSQAIDSWDLHEKAIRRAEALIRKESR